MQTVSQIKRKQDAHSKIQMGGLIVKAGLDYLHPKESAILLGILVDAKQKLDSDDKYEYLDYYQKLGFKEFSK
ncbi:conjugal transfer protein TraD [Candidatus Jidaibacter acanthamoebae]|nr:conjugal transfer protein TraD [Candidatus Jidaibacter acanthamoeba]